MLRSIWHTCFAVSDLDRSLRFYRDLLGLELVHLQRQANAYTRKLVGYGNADLKVALLHLPGQPAARSGHELELIEYVSPRGKRIDLSSPNIGAPHMAFEVEDIFSAYRRLESHGVCFRSEPVAIEEGRHRGGYSVYLADPDGITLELVQPPRGESETTKTHAQA